MQPVVTTFRNNILTGDPDRNASAEQQVALYEAETR